ncbi:hypothetical protein FDP41_009644 [Naegleria fowleri]|uniref:Uncharacterized protein n=1 Tax=Naegleria fowleri TaxID=5763 RepID=A0A6A5BDE2_NAEFO|nr:uncharacterized protein FDP41_009644 [Naegleria fowleri]KAF0971948.1 hypothetical protein FDP41_009644 [Naegleria fowleri]CAG4709071.1 unnamed protein product [Naegleria fowleri]
MMIHSNTAITETSTLTSSTTIKDNRNSSTTTHSQPKDISSVASSSSTDEEEDTILSKSLGHFNSSQGTNMPRGSYHDIKSRYFMSLNLSQQKTPPPQTSPLPNSSGAPSATSPRATNNDNTNVNRPQRTSSLSVQLSKQSSTTSPVDKQSPKEASKKQTQIDFYKHSQAIPIPTKVSNPFPMIDNSVVTPNHGTTYEPSLVPSLMNDDTAPMMFDGDFSFTDSSESGSIDLAPFFTTQVTISPNKNNTSSKTTQLKSSMKSTAPSSSKQKGVQKSVSMKIETTTSVVRDEDIDDDRSPLTPNRNIIPPHLLNNRSDFSLYRQQQKHNTKVYKI